MKIRQAIKKVVALGTGALMLGATVIGASAANLSDYPNMFLDDGQVNAKIVIGEQADTIDVVGAIDIAAGLQAKAVSTEAVTVTGSGIEVSGGKTKEITLGAQLAGDFGSLDDADISSLKDEKITWNDEDIDVDETITVNNVTVMISADDADFGSSPVLGTSVKDAIKYRYTLDDSDLDTADVTDSDQLKIELLGKSVEIESVTNAATDQITISVASEYYMNIGDSVTVDGKTIKLVNVGMSSVVVDVDGEIQTIANDGDEKVGGIRVSVPDGNIFYVDEKEDRAVTLKIGDKITESVSSGDSMELFGEPSKESDAEWLWYIEVGADNSSLEIGADFNQKYDTDTEPVKTVGEAFVLPNDYAKIYIDSLTADADAEIKFELDDGISVDVDTDGTTAVTTLDDQKALVITSTDEILKIGASDETDTLYYILDNSDDVRTAFENSDGDIQLGASNSTITIDYDSTDMSMVWLNTSDATAGVNITDSDGELGGGWIYLAADLGSLRFGTHEDEYDSATDMTHSGVLASIDKEEDYITTYGIVVTAIEDGFDSDEFTMTLPDEQVKANVVVVGSDAVVSSSGSSVTTEKVNPVGVDFAVLDKDAPSAGTQNLIVVGGPCINTEAARLLGNPANCAEGFAEGEAKLALFDDDGKVALLVAGYEGKDTLGAVRALLTAEDLPAKSDAKVITTNYKTPTVE